MHADDPLGTGRQVDLQLLDQVLAQALGAAQARLEVEPLVVEIVAPAAAARPDAGDLEPARALVAARVRPALVRRGGPGIGRVLVRRHVGRAVQRALARAGRRLLGRRLVWRRLRALVLALEERVLLELALDVGRKLEVAQLQQLDRLLQLRRHHQGLALTHIQS